MEGIALCTVVFTIQSQRHFSDSLSLDKISKAEVTLTREKLDDTHEPTQPIVELICQLMWPFNWHDRQRITEYVRSILGGDRPENS